MRSIARLVTRLQGKGDGLIVGSTLEGQSFFEPNTVYEIVEVLGVPTIRKIGKACGLDEHEKLKNSSEGNLWFGKFFSWAHGIAEILEARKSSLFLSRAEWDAAEKAGKTCPSTNELCEHNCEKKQCKILED